MQILHASDLFEDAVSRSYYAVMHAAKAAVAGLALPVEYRKYKTAFPVAPPAPSSTRLSPRHGRLPHPAPGGWPYALPAARRPQDG